MPEETSTPADATSRVLQQVMRESKNEEPKEESKEDLIQLLKSRLDDLQKMQALLSSLQSLREKLECAPIQELPKWFYAISLRFLGINT